MFLIPKSTVFIKIRMSAQFLCLPFLLFQLRAYYNTHLQLEHAHLLTHVRECTSPLFQVQLSGFS
jgi:hypothetical protein